VNQTEKCGIDYFGMIHAFKQAQKSYDSEEVPVGAVLVDEKGKIVARAYNRVEYKNSQLGHAEIQVLDKISKKMKCWRLNNLTLYVTLQPCMMCMGALILSRIGRIVYAAKSPLFGYDLDKQGQFGIYKDSLTIIEFQEKVESVKLLKKFFAGQRRIKYDS